VTQRRVSIRTDDYSGRAGRTMVGERVEGAELLAGRGQSPIQKRRAREAQKIFVRVGLCEFWDKALKSFAMFS
jgi:hypothetical protein